MKFNVLVLTFAVFMLSGCNEGQQVSQLRLQKTELSRELKNQESSHKTEISDLKSSHEKELEQVRNEYDTTLATKDKEIAELQKTVEMNKLALDGYAKILIETIGNVQKAEAEVERLTAENQEMASKLEKHQLTPQETQQKLEQMKQLRKKAIEQSNE